MFNLIELVGSDEENIRRYDVEFNKECTVEEFVQTVLAKNRMGWGCIGINNDIYSDFLSRTFGSPHCTYRYGEIITNPFAPEILEQKVVKATASRSTSFDVDYKLWTKKE